jgi:hypothetical protein
MNFNIKKDNTLNLGLNKQESKGTLLQVKSIVRTRDTELNMDPHLYVIVADPQFLEKSVDKLCHSPPPPISLF